MIYASPDLDQGVIRERNGKRFFLRLWPRPMFLKEMANGMWKDMEGVRDDFNQAALVEVRDQFVERNRPSCPDLVASILQGQQFLDGCRLSNELEILLSLQRRIKAQERFLSVIPPAILSLIQQYPEVHFPLLKLFASHPEAVDMAQSNPMLAFLLATHARWCEPSETVTVDTIHHMLHRKRRDILTCFGFDHSSKSLVRLIGRVSPWACRSELIVGFRESLRDPGNMRRLRHIERMNFGTMAIAADKRMLAWVTNAFLHEVAADPQEDRQDCTARQLDAHLPHEEEGCLSKPSHRIHSRKKLRTGLVASTVFMTSDEVEALGLSLPKAPFEDTPQIQALQTPDAIFEEAKEQGNCAWEMLRQFIPGNLFLYRVLAPERATLSIAGSGDDWRIEELEAARNNPVSAVTAWYVQRWLTGAMSAVRNQSTCDAPFETLCTLGHTENCSGA